MRSFSVGRVPVLDAARRHRAARLSGLKWRTDAGRMLVFARSRALPLAQESTMLKLITTAVAALALLAGSASAAPRFDGLMGHLDPMCGCEPPPPPPPPEEPEKGNNGWGNGADPSNPGSDHGAALTAR